MGVMVDFHCHGKMLKLKYSDGRQELHYGGEEDIKKIFLKAESEDENIKGELSNCGYQLKDEFRGEVHICPNCQTKMEEFGFKQNQQIWHNGLGTLTMKL